MEKVCYVQSVNSLQNYLRDVFVQNKIYEPTITDKRIITAKHQILSKKAYGLNLKSITFREISEFMLGYEILESYSNICKNFEET